jgi:hypothetical protein
LRPPRQLGGADVLVVGLDPPDVAAALSHSRPTVINAKRGVGKLTPAEPQDCADPMSPMQLLTMNNAAAKAIRGSQRDKGIVGCRLRRGGRFGGMAGHPEGHPLSWLVWPSRDPLGPGPHSVRRRPGRAVPRNLSVPLRPTAGPGGAGPASRQSPGPPPRMTTSNAGDHRFRGRSRRAGAG